MRLKVTYVVFCLAGSSILYFRLQVIHKSYRQAPTPVNNFQLLLKLKILDKLRLVTFHKNTLQMKTQHFNWFNLVQEKWEFSTEHQHYNACRLSMLTFSLSMQHKLPHFVAAVCNNVIITHTLIFMVQKLPF
jgi:hypothetical protein